VKAKNIRSEWSAEELAAHLNGERQRVFNLLVQRQAQQLENTAEVHRTRRDIARMLTVARERELARLRGLGPQDLRPVMAQLEAKLCETVRLARDRSSDVSKGEAKALKRQIGRLRGILKEKESAS